MAGEGATVCVTGAGGFLGSWVIKFLLSKGYKVNGTVREPNDEKNSHLKRLENAPENLRLFKADLLDYDALSSAMEGCEGVFHVASPLPATKVLNPELEIITPAVTGTVNVLKACSNVKVKKLVVVSSVAAVSLNPNWPENKIKDESCWSDKDYCKKIENWYCLSKILAEGAAVEYAEKEGLNVITLCPSFVLGPLLQPTMNASSLFLLDLIKGGVSLADMLWHFVDVRDVADALLLVYEKPEASGRYICAPHPSNIHDIIEMLKNMYPDYAYPKSYVNRDQGAQLSSEKLKIMGWKYRTLKETLTDTVESYREIGVLDMN